MNLSPRLPELLARIAECAGEAAALALANHYGGRGIYIPENSTPDSLLARIVGTEAAAAISRTIGAGEVQVPIGPRGWNERARLAVAECVAKGMSASEIAGALGISERSVFRIKRQLGFKRRRRLHPESG